MASMYLPCFHGPILIIPATEAVRWMATGGWSPVEPWRTRGLVDELDDDAVTRLLDELDGPGAPRHGDPHQGRARLVEALLPAPVGRGRLCMLVRERPALDPDGGLVITPLLSVGSAA